MNPINSLPSAIITSLTTSGTSIAIINQIQADLKTKVYLKGEFIFVADQEIQSVYGINSGIAKLYFMDHFGNEFTVKLMKSGDVIGYRQIMENEKFVGYIQVLEDVEVSMLSKNLFLHLLEVDLGFCRRIIERLCSDIRLAKEVIANLSLKDVKHRICSVLLKLHEQFSEKGSDEIQNELSREDFAKLVGVARESLSRSLSELVSEKIILIEKKKIKILDWNQLNKLSKI